MHVLLAAAAGAEEAGQTPAFLTEVAALVVAAAVIAYLSIRVRQLPIVGFLIAGTLVGPNALGLVSSVETVNAAAEIGVILLLFTIGIEFSLERLMRIRRLIMVGGGMQVLLTVALVAGVLMAFGVGWNVGVYTGFLVALSSTAIVLKLLADQGRTNAPAGQVTVGLLIFQDLAIIAMVLLVPMLAGEAGGPLEIGLALAQAVGIIIVILVGARRIMPRVLEAVARTCSQEIFLLVVIAICIGTALLTSFVGVSVSLGAFLAGLLVSESRFDVQALGEVLPLQILFSAVFFVSVGMLLDPAFLVSNPGIVVAGILIVLAIKILTTGAAVRLLGQSWAVAATAAFTLAQVGEFSFVLEGVGRGAGLSPAGLDETGSQAFIAVTVLLMVATPGLNWLGTRAGRRVSARMPSPVATPQDNVDGSHDPRGHVILAGYGSAARSVADVLDSTAIEYVITTLNPDGASEAEALGRRVYRGDASRPQTLEAAGVDRAHVVVVADDDAETARAVTQAVANRRPDVAVLVRIADGDPEELSDAGARAVITQEAASSLAVSVHVLRQFGMANAAIADQIDRAGPGHGWAPDVVTAKHEQIDQDQEVTLTPDPDAGCAHGDQIRTVAPSAPGCEDCLRIGANWVHLRICMLCGHAGCCDSSPNRHATQHFHQTTHPVIASLEADEDWGWCYVDEVCL